MVQYRHMLAVTVWFPTQEDSSMTIDVATGIARILKQEGVD